MFGFHKKDKKEVPLDEINKMMRKGMNDKDIIRQLKSKGYSYNAIEKAMLHAVKTGVDDKTKEQREEYEVPTQEDFFDEGTGTEAAFEPAGVEELFAPPEEDYQNLPEFTEQAQPIEELVEGLVEEKWQRFQDEIMRLEDLIERTKADLKSVEERINVTNQQQPAAEIESRLTEMGDRIEDVEARIGGLERAFKQFLPSLTRNIESLSSMVAEIKAGKHTQEESEKEEVKV